MTFPDNAADKITVNHYNPIAHGPAAAFSCYALGLHVAAMTPRETLIDHSRRCHALLLIDNCEHVVAACAEHVETLPRAWHRKRP